MLDDDEIQEAERALAELKQQLMQKRRKKACANKQSQEKVAEAGHAESNPKKEQNKAAKQKAQDDASATPATKKSKVQEDKQHAAADTSKASSKPKNDRKNDAQRQQANQSEGVLRRSVSWSDKADPFTTPQRQSKTSPPTTSGETDKPCHGFLVVTLRVCFSLGYHGLIRQKGHLAQFATPKQ